MVTKRPLTQKETEDGIRQLKEYAADADIPIDGIAVSYTHLDVYKRQPQAEVEQACSEGPG